MNGGNLKQAATNKVKQAANVVQDATAAANGGKKRRKGTDLKPIITTEGPQDSDGSPLSAQAVNAKYVHLASARLLWATLY